jgi:hypothetical protein
MVVTYADVVEAGFPSSFVANPFLFSKFRALIPRLGLHFRKGELI